MRAKLGSTRRTALLGLAAAAIIAGVVIAIVTGPGPHHGRPPHPHPHARVGALRVTRSELALASAYLGVGVARLRGELRAGSSLAELAGRVPGHSAHGLLEALLHPRARRIERSRARGRISAHHASVRIARLRTRMQRLLEGQVSS